MAYAFDPDREENVYTQLLKSAGYEEKNSKEEFEEFILELNRSFKDDNVFDPSLISKMKYRVNKKDNSVVFLDKPYMDIMWLLEQEDFEIYLGYEEYEVLIDKNGKTYNKPLKLDEEDRINLLTQVSNFQGSLIATKQALRNKEEMKDLIKDTEEYELIFDLLNNQINDSNDFISRLASINKDREIFTAKEFHEEIEKAVEQQDALKLQRLVRMTTLKELKQYLSEQN